ncbi:FG-GAP-like repeat-containing protein [Streptomyces sp. ISL-86]|uniref:FG-GAP-like repeat-containing protein n=2 Tax=unclassified Streptomyces TaxID=2593676 RepID=UPI001BE946BD|nr:FG-GAP-like repeat-containing protein [Streptomyces sp. ISL-86]MBT2458515.1 VCBS repeat-containing protein [Streptomyces sp. ISL-86]
MAAPRAAATFAALSLTATGLTLAGAGTAQAATVPFTSALNSASISADADPSTADFDGTGASLSASDLDNAGWTRGARITVNGTTYTRPDVAPGQPDNVLATGQRVAVSGTGNAVGFLASATRGPVSATGKITYSDGTTSAYTLAVDDWKTGSAVTAAVTLPHANTRGGQQNGPVRLYGVTVPVTPGKKVASVTLPKASATVTGTSPALHVYSVAVRTTPAAPGKKTWTGSWAASFGSAPAIVPAKDWRDQTFRMVVNPHTTGGTARIRFANTFSPTPVVFGHATVATQKTGATATTAPVSLTFGGSQQVTIPAGGEVFSDPVTFPVTAGRNLLVSIHLPGPVTAAPVHEYALTTSYSTSRLAGDHTADSAATSFPGTIAYWTFLSGIDVATTGNPGTIVALGDSQTDGGHSTRDANRRWPDYYAAILRATPGAPGVLNEGISANEVLRNRIIVPASPSALNRLDRDVFSQTNVRTVVLYEGINDIVQDSDAAAMQDGIRRIAAQSRARGLRIVVATIPAFAGYSGYSDGREDIRQAINAYIRTTGDIDSYIDFDLVTRDPDMPHVLRDGLADPADHLHFNDAGTKLLAETLAAATNGTAVRTSQSTAADFDGDKVADLIAREDATGTLKMWRGKGDGTLAAETALTTGWRPYSQTTAGDFTSDGKADLIARDGSGNLLLWVGNGDGTFKRAVTLTDGWYFPQTAAGDFNADGKVDLVAKDSASNLKMWLGNGDGTFARPSTLTGGWDFTQTIAGDFNGDRQADIMARDGNGTLKLWIHNSGGTFNGAVDVTSGWNFTQTTTGDFTKDGRADLIARDTAGTLKMWPGNANGTFGAAQTLTAGW